ncbi:type VII secretion protein EccE [Mycobacterium sp. ACS1612]|uniref:type VII secretion protein EccE n=1 Tax=Mycobacterium sp. ACS1612 TaxID=1834117 RepID=UPI001E2D59FF|nr:type VII secretion protein EccE [Mycobacterium sp. ACS1612]
MECLGTSGLAIALSLGRRGWYGVVAGICVALTFVLRVRGRTIATLLVSRFRFWWTRRQRTHTAQHFEPFDFQLSDGSLMGFHWDGRVLTASMRIQEKPHALTVMDRAGIVSGEVISVRMLADCLRQFDITLDSIDIISQGARSRGHGQLAATYDALLGPLPAIAVRSVLVTVRLDPTLCPEAVRNRGGGWDGILRTAVIATRRVANKLSDTGLRPQILPAREVSLATDELLDGLGLAALEEKWLVCRRGRFQVRSFALRPALFTTAGLARLWAVPSYSTTLCVSLRRDEHSGFVALRGLTRFSRHGRVRVPLRGLSELRGAQYAALVCSLPVPSPRRSIQQWFVGKTEDAVEGLVLPAYGCGQLLGADEHDRAVALTLFGPNIGRVEMYGTLHLAQQVVLRALALGARIRVHTNRIDGWSAMVRQVGDESFLRIGAGGRSASSEYSVEMFDGVAEHSVRPGVTTMVINPSQARPSQQPDVTMRLLDEDRDTVHVETNSGSTIVTMVTTDDEMRYLRPSFTMGD